MTRDTLEMARLRRAMRCPKQLDDSHDDSPRDELTQEQILQVLREEHARLAEIARAALVCVVKGRQAAMTRDTVSTTVSIAGLVDGMALGAEEAEALAQLLDAAIIQPMPATAQTLRGRARMRELANVLRGRRRYDSNPEEPE